MARNNWLTVVSALTVICAIGGSANSQTATYSTQAAKRDGYLKTMLCVVANSRAHDDRERAGDTEKAARYEAQMQNSFAVAHVEGEAIGYSSDQISKDLEGLETTALPKMFKDQPYYYSVVAYCKYLKLM